MVVKTRALLAHRVQIGDAGPSTSSWRWTCWAPSWGFAGAGTPGTRLPEASTKVYQGCLRALL